MSCSRAALQLFAEAQAPCQGEEHLWQDEIRGPRMHVCEFPGFLQI